MAKPRTKTTVNQDLPEARPTFGERFHAWWEGYDVNALAARNRIVPPEEPEPDDDPVQPPMHGDWPTEHIELVQLLWGPGFISPGDASFIIDLVRAFRLYSESTVLDIGTGLGGGARAIVGEHKSYISCWERDPELVAEGMAQAKAERKNVDAAIHHLDLGNISFQKDFFGVALVRDTLFEIDDDQKRSLLAGVVKSVKNGGNIVIADLVSAGSEADLADWVAGERGDVHLWNAADLSACLDNLDVECSTVEDQTDSYLSMIRRGLAEFANLLAERNPTPDKLISTLTEVEYWKRRIAALESGALRFHVVTATKP